ncbi:MAG: hypothetical protein V4726_10425 [Verrucomicrobiota bacterium]
MPPLFATLRFLNHRSLPADGAWNMACDEALLKTLEPGEPPILRVYRWDRPTLSFGYFLKYADAIAAAGAEESVIRRWTGGGLVHHGRDFTWSLLVPRSHAFAQVRPAESYGQLHGAVAGALSGLGMGGAVVVPADSPAPRAGLCFEAPAPGDLLLHGRKIAGAGQRRTRQGLLHQASLCLPAVRPPEQNQDQPGNHPRSSPGPVPAPGLLEKLGDLLSRQLGAEVLPFCLPHDLEIPRSRYADPDWNTRI